MWTKILPYSGEYAQESFDLCAAADGGYYLLSKFKPKLNPPSAPYFLITRLDADYEVIWIR